MLGCSYKVDSTYMMLSRVIEYEGAIVEYTDRDIGLILQNLEKNFALMTCKIGGKKIASCLDFMVLMLDHMFRITMKNLKKMKMDCGQ
uniref:Uncharacterized protein n=1 Tax=Solanum lycopersicum TaxID=4081 RepID=A0A3Q7GVS0_SOLLC